MRKIFSYQSLTSASQIWIAICNMLKTLGNSKVAITCVSNSRSGEDRPPKFVRRLFGKIRFQVL